LRGIEQCYEDLVVKFPGSSSLLLDYAQFCEDILNDQAKASKLRSGADTFEPGAPLLPLPAPGAASRAKTGG
jgi:hypothetical protein